MSVNTVIRRIKVGTVLSVAMAPLLGGCLGLEPISATTAGATAAFIHEDKLPTDYLAEAVTGKDCSYVRHLEDKGPFCRGHDYGKVLEEPIYCYKSLGTVTCYRQPDPYGTGARPVE